MRPNFVLRYHGFAYANREVRYHSIERRSSIELRQHVINRVLVCFGLCHTALRGRQLRRQLRALCIHLSQPRLVFAKCRLGRFIIRYFLIVVLLGYQLVLPELFIPVQYDLGSFQFGFGMIDSSCRCGDRIVLYFRASLGRRGIRQSEATAAF